MKTMTTAVAVIGIALLSACNTQQKDVHTAANQHIIDSLKTELVRQQVIDSMNQVAARAEAEKPRAVTTHVVYRAPRKKPVARKPKHSVSDNRVESYAGYKPNTPVYREPAQVYQEPVPVQQPAKKGWSAKAKGAVIGAGAGAAAGAIINKRNRAAGAVIGGVLGAGAGTGIGAIIDKKNGR